MKLNLSRLPGILVLLWMLMTALPLYCSASDFLKVDGTNIRDSYGAGKDVHLYGTNLGGWRVHEPWMSPLAGASNEWDARNTLTARFGETAVSDLYNTYWNSWITDIDFKNIADAGLNCIRLPIYALNHIDDEGNWRLDDNGAIDLSRIEWAVNKAQEYGLYTILDLHGAPGSQNGAHHSGRQNGTLLYSTPRYQNQLVALWETLATRFKGNAAVAGYDLLNEPSGTFPGAMGPEVVNLYDRLYQAIRKIDPDHIIIMEAIWWWDTLPNPQEKSWENVVYSLHYYQWQNNDDFAVMKSAVDGWIQDAKKWGSEYNVPHFIGEFTLFGNTESWNYGLQQFTETGSHWTTWSYKVMGRNNWGMYNTAEQNSNVVNIDTDDLNTIKYKWGQWNTPDYFSPNATVINAMQKATLGLNLKRPTQVFTAKAEKPVPQNNPVKVAEAFKFAGTQTLQNERQEDTLTALNAEVEQKQAVSELNVDEKINIGLPQDKDQLHQEVNELKAKVVTLEDLNESLLQDQQVLQQHDAILKQKDLENHSVKLNNS